MEQNAALWSLNLKDNSNLGEGSALAFANALQNNQTMCHFMIMNCNIGVKGQAVIENAVIASDNPNFYGHWTGLNNLADLCKTNAENLDKLSPYLSSESSKWRGTLNEMAFEQIHDVNRHLPALICKGVYKEQVEWFQKEVADLPVATASNTTCFANLTRKNDDGFCPLDNPETWKHFPEIFKKLIANGDPIGLPRLLETDRHGTSWLENGLLHNPKQMLQTLNENGITLKGKRLLTEDGTLAPFVSKLAERGELAPLFTEANWHGAKPFELTSVLKLLNKEQLAQIPNQHVLRATHLQQPQTSVGRR